MFRDYSSTFDEFKANVKQHPILLKKLGLELNVQSVYRWEMDNAIKCGDPFVCLRMTAELNWYNANRPYFNVYPLIEKKLLELSGDLKMSELHLPFKTIEVRTNRQTILMAEVNEGFLFVFEFGNKQYQEVLVRKCESVGVIADSPYREWDSTSPFRNDNGKRADSNLRKEAVFICAGVCLLAADKSIVSPVLLNKHRRENMTPAEVAEYAAKAIKRCGKTGFDVGRNIERMKATAHYRNGCFAKYYVGRDHECFPSTCELSKAAIIKWRCGSIVNKDNLPTVPTGYKGGAL